MSTNDDTPKGDEVEQWLQNTVIPAHDRLKQDPNNRLTPEQVRRSLEEQQSKKENFSEQVWNESSRETRSGPSEEEPQTSLNTEPLELNKSIPATTAEQPQNVKKYERASALPGDNEQTT